MSETPAEPAAIDYATPLGRVRLLVPDTDPDPDRQLLEDAQLLAFLGMEGVTATEARAGADDVPLRSVRLAAAMALDVVASSEAIVGKKIRQEDKSSDGPAVAKELRERAASLRRLVEAEDYAEAAACTYVLDFGAY